MRNFLLQLLLFHVLLIDKVMCRPNSELKSASDSCKWRPIVRNAKLKGGIGSGTFHRLGYTPNMETCVDLCCHMDVCGVAFRNKDDCFGIECNSDESCESIPADAGDTRVEIAHVRAGHKSGNLTDMTMAGQCKPSTIYKEVTLKGGINAGTYKDVGGVTTMEECQKKCCEFPACDLSFMLAGSCYLVGCGDQKQCAMQPAKESKFHPMISYVTRWNNEGVKHTVLLQEKGIQHTCGKLQPLVKVTLKGGLQAGEFTDVGKVATLAQCYDICCQQESCDLAFMLGQNCFSVQCKDKRLCTTIPAQPSIFNPQIAYVIKRSKGTAKTNIAAVSGDCPKTKVFEKMTLKGGVDAGAYKDHGKVKDMKVCRRICCEMTECHLAFMLGTNCFSVKCASVDACRAQKAKPSAYYPRISYIRKVGSNELLRSTIQPVPSLNQTISGPQFTNVDMSQQHTLNAAVLQNTNLLQQNAIQAKPTGRNNVIESPMASQIPPGKATGQVGFAVTPNGLLPVNNQVLQNTQTSLNKAPGTSTFPTNGVSNTSTTARSSIASTSTTEKSTSTSTSTVKQTSPSVAAFNSSHSNETSVKDQDLMNALEAADSKDVPAKQQNVTAYEEMPINHEKCTPGYLKSNVTLKGGRKSGEFLEIKGLKDMSKCVKRCCEDRDKKCNLAFMLGDTCYSVACKTPDLCRTIAAPPTKFNPQVQYVRGLEEEPMPSTTSTTSTTARSTTTPAPTTSSPSQESDNEDTTTTTQASHKDNSSKQAIKNKIKSCFSQPIVKEKSIKGGKKAGKFKIFKDIKDMDACMAKCCSLKKQCDVAYMEGGKCFSIQCFKKSACTAVTLRESDMNPRFAYMDHFLEKVDEEEAESDSTDLDVNEDSSCVNVEILSNKTLKGGTKAGKFRPMGKEKSMKSCINSCCDRPDCDIAYLLNDHCYAVECTDGSLCQATSDSVKSGDNVQLAYMNKAGVGEKQRDYMVVYIIVGSLAFAATLGGLIWVVFAFSRKQRIKKSHKRLLDDNDDDEEVEEDVVHKRTSRPRYRQPRY